MHTASAEAGTLIPFDAGAGVFNTTDARVLDEVGLGATGRTLYNDHYRTMQPFFLIREGRMDFDRVLSEYVWDWRDFGDIEFAVDFMLRNSMVKTLSCPSRGHEITLAFYRSRFSRGFTEPEIATLGLTNEYLNNLYISFHKRNSAVDPILTAEEIARRFRVFSRREAEVCSLVARRLNTAEIAACLFISPRTVEKHIESIFDKLEVRSREQLRWRLGALPADSQCEA